RWMEGDVARARARAHDSIAAVYVTQRLLSSRFLLPASRFPPFAVEVETVDEHSVDTEVCGEHETIGGVGKNAVGMRRSLALGIRPFSRVLNRVRGRGDCSIRFNRQHRDTS